MRWFAPSEYRCRCGSPDCAAPLDLDPLMQLRLDALRESYGKPIILTSGLRCARWNLLVGGVRDSAHLTGRAVDIRLEDAVSRRCLVRLADVGNTEYGGDFPLIELCPRHLHLDMTPRPEPLLILGAG